MLRFELESTGVHPAMVNAGVQLFERGRVTSDPEAA